MSPGMLAGAGLLALGCVSALAQQTTGVPGSPGATTTIDGKQLPPPDPKFLRLIFISKAPHGLKATRAL
jgi:arylsulfatase